ncbi:MAG: hypothetical protein RSA29_08410 [Clostridium sp.]|uniref:hypothetical protein n=1 Tax=Clostridium sp. TaxID=1506 RepID=UPI003028BA3F
MKKFNENTQTDFEKLGDTKVNDVKNTREDKNIHLDKIDISEEGLYKQLKADDDKEEEKKDEYINPSMKKFRIVIGGLCLAIFVLFMFQGTPNKTYKDNLTAGAIENVNIGDILSKEALKLDAKDASIEISNGFGNLEISIWNFVEKEDNDYVQVLIDGVSQGAPFSIRHKPVKVSVPDKAVIQVQGVRDGSNNGITYAVHFNKTGDTYLNTVPLNAMNNYTIISK